MKRTFFENNLTTLTLQRNFLIVLSLLLAIGMILALSFLFMKNEKIVVVPAVIEKEFWVDSNSVSASYLEQMGLYLGQLLLTKSAYSADAQRTILCRHAEPSYISRLKQRLIEEEEVLKKQNASCVFYLNNILVNPEQLTATIVGERRFFVAGGEISNENCVYRLHFSYKGARLLLKEITKEKELKLFGGD